jgi:hypothetical protein
MGDVLAHVAGLARMPQVELLQEIHRYAAKASKAFGADPEETPSGGDSDAPIEPKRDDDLVQLEAQKQEDLLARKEDDGSFVQYIPAVRGIEHPGIVVESKVMASVDGPAITYKLNLPAKKMAAAPKQPSAVQLELAARVGQAHNTLNGAGERHGFLNGDGTGSGKGQENALVIWDNFRQGRKRSLWLSGSADLIEQAKGDFVGIGADDMAEKLYPISDWTRHDAIDAPEGVLFSTYATLARKEINKEGKTRLDQIIEWLGPDGVIIFDEAQKGKNAVPGEQQIAGSAAGAAVVKMQERLPQARVVYVSATAATEVRNLGYMTRLGLWGRGTPFTSGFQHFMSEVGNGGIAAMELIARELKANGRFLSR